MKRIESIDFVRGLVIVIMAIDHIRDLMQVNGTDPTDIATTTPIYFMTRWITHLCAPTFVFLAGTSAFLTMKSQNNLTETRRFLRTRGLWLIFLELTVIGFGIWFDVLYRAVLLQVIFAIGMSFIILSFLLKLKPTTIGGIGLTIILTHNLIGVFQLTQIPVLGVILGAFFSPNLFPVGHVTVASMYPILPWLGIMLLGFSFGQVYEQPSEQRKSILFKAGLISLLLFVALRTFNFYGDPAHWLPQRSELFSALSFVNVTKYPPSLLFDALLLGIMFLLLAISDGVSNGITRFFLTFGRVPLFFYLLHWYVIHISMFVMVFLQGAKWEDLVFGPFQFGRPAQGGGLELPYIYLYWACLILAFYPLCQWYGRYKAANRDKKWLSYL